MCYLITNGVDNTYQLLLILTQLSQYLFKKYAAYNNRKTIDYFRGAAYSFNHQHKNYVSSY